MADLEADVLPAIVNLIDAVIYPNGDTHPSAVTLSSSLSASCLANATSLVLPVSPQIAPLSYITFGDANPETVQVASTYAQPAAGATTTTAPLVAGTQFAHSSGAALSLNLFIKIYPGWPQADQLDSDLRAGYVHVSVFAPGGGGGGAAQVMEDAQVIAAPVHTIVPTLAANVLTLSGSVTTGQYVTVILDNTRAFSYAAQVGDTLATIAAQLAGLIQVISQYAATRASGDILTISGASYITVRIGAPGTMGQLQHRTKVPVRVITWAPTPAARAATAKVIDPYLQDNFRLSFSDASQGLLFYSMTSVDDVPQKAWLFRRDLVYTAEYGAVSTFAAYEVTSVNITLDPGIGTSSAPSSQARQTQAIDTSQETPI